MSDPPGCSTNGPEQPDRSKTPHVESQPGIMLPAAIDTASIEEAVAAQAAEVRRLKEDEGLGNKDEAVVAAVAELLRLKAELEDA